MRDATPTLPLEILPHILEHLRWRTRDLHACCLVSKTWQHYATPKLYSRLFLRDQTRLIKVFKSLEAKGELARLVRVLEIRVFPFGLKAEDLERLEESLLSSLLKATNLQELYWTRTGSFTDRVITFLSTLPSLETLELTGSSRFYTPANVTKHLVSSDKTPALRHFSILLPDRRVCEELPQWARQLGSKLQSFSVLCQHSATITDVILRDVAEHLTGLVRLSIAGAKQVTADGIAAFLQSGAMQELSIEGLAVHPAHFPRLSPQLSKLHTLSLTYPKHSLCPPQEFWQNLASFVEHLPALTSFTLYRSSWNTSKLGEEDMLDVGMDEADDSLGSEGQERSEQSRLEYRRQEMEHHAETGQPIIREPRLSATFLKRFLLAKGSSLQKLRIHGIVATGEQVRAICEACPVLQDVVLHLFEDDNSLLETCFAKLPHLVSLHILSPLYSHMFLSDQDLKGIARRCSNTLRQLGFRNRVWLVDREPVTGGETDEEAPLRIIETALAARPFLRSMSTAPE